MPNWIQVQAWYDTESGKYYMGAQPPMNPQPQQQSQQSQGTVYIGQAGERLRQQQQTLHSQPQQQRYYNPAGVPTRVAAGVQGGPLIQYNYQPQQSQQSYATYPPYAPYQPRYEWVPGSNGQPVAVRLGEYQREQPAAFEIMHNSQGVPVRVPVYASMNNSAAAVRREDQIIGGPNQSVASSTTSSVATTPKVRSMPEPVPNQQYIEERNTTSNQRLTNEELNALTGTTTETTYSDPTTSLPVPSEVDPTTLAIYTERIRKEEESKANSLQNVVGASPEDVRTLSDEEILREALRRIKRDDEALKEAEKNTSVQYVGI